MAEDQSWRSRLYGNITGGQLNAALLAFSGHWERRSMFPREPDPKQAFKTIGKLAAVPYWIAFYDLTFPVFVATGAQISGGREAVEEAAKSPDPYTAIKEAVSHLNENDPEHPAAAPFALAMIANLEAIARYSRSINEMLAAFRTRGDLEALGQALSVDSAITLLPFCQAMLKYGQLTGDELFAKEVFKAVRGPHKKRLQYRKLRWAEYLLWESGALDACTQDEIHELVVVHLAHLGLFGDDEEHANSKANLFKNFRAWRKEREGKHRRKGDRHSAT